MSISEINKTNLRNILEEAVLERSSTNDQLASYMDRMETWLAHASPRWDSPNTKCASRSNHFLHGFFEEAWPHPFYDVESDRQKCQEESDRAQREKEWIANTKRIRQAITAIHTAALTDRQVMAINKVEEGMTELIPRDVKGDEPLKALQGAIEEIQDLIFSMDTWLERWNTLIESEWKKNRQLDLLRDLRRSLSYDYESTSTTVLDGGLAGGDYTSTKNHRVYYFPQELWDDFPGIVDFGKQFYREVLAVLRQIESIVEKNRV